MPEYLAPGVYVEEIDTGNKPIEGVSTSTAGMIGVTERGPVDIPILVTSTGEYTRWFGGRLDRAFFKDHSYLPHAVEGFFTNGGKRVFITRVLNRAFAEWAETLLFDRSILNSASSRLLHRSLGDAVDLYVLDGAGLASNNWLQIDDGVEVEYQKISAAPAAANQVALRIPLAFGYDPGGGVVTVDHFKTMGGAASSPQLDLAVKPGDTQISVSGGGAIGAGALLRIGTLANGDEEYAIASAENPAAPAARVVTLRTPAMLAHSGGVGNTVDLLPALGAAPNTTTLSVASTPGDAAILVASNTNFTTPGEFVRISDASHTELRRIGKLGILTLDLPAYADYASAASVDIVTRADAAGTSNKILMVEATEGSNILNLDDRQLLIEGDVVRVGQAIAVDVEYMTISAIPNRLPGKDPGKVVLTASLQATHYAGAQVREQTVATAPPPALAVAHPALLTQRNITELVVSDTSNIAAPAILRVRTTAQQAYYHRLTVPPATPAPMRVTLGIKLTRPHPAGAAIVAREPLMQVRALDPGAWGNRLRVSVQDQSPPLVNTRIRMIGGIADSTHIRLESANGIEIGTVLQRADASGNPIDMPFKVIDIDHQNGYLLTLDPAHPVSAATAPGDAVRSREFQLDVFLLRQPDPAVPTRDEQVLDTETFRNLSMDSRHSRYLHKVIGRTWSAVPGTTVDGDGISLRLADRRSEGESKYIRIHDFAQDLLGAAKLNALESIRLGPDALTDQLADGRRRPTRRMLLGGDDAIGSLDDGAYFGHDHPNPENRTGLQSLRNIEEISIVACPGRTSSTIQNALINHCELMRYRFAVLDGPRPPNDSLADVQSQRQQFDTKYAALYHPWLLVPDPYPTSLARIADYPIPPSGHMLGVYARTDIERGVHKAPANEVVRGILGLQRILNKEQHDILNPYPVNINVIRDFRNNNRGIRVYGGRVITSDSDWKYVNVRRLLIFIENSIDRGLQWVVFEPNAEPLWARVRRSIANFLTLVWRNGGLEGAKVEEAYFVKCDRTTMTQTDIDSGRLIVVIGVAPVKPAEYVVVRIGLWTAHADD
jgi:phage tail sheath protein FI